MSAQAVPHYQCTTEEIVQEFLRAVLVDPSYVLDMAKDARGLRRLRVGRGQKRPRQAPESCKVQSCEQPSRTRQYCVAHYDRLRRLGDVFEHLPVGQRGKALA